MKSASILFTATAAILIGTATPARAVDGCKVLLCLAGPWQEIAACVGEVEQLFRDLRRGDPFPSCTYASGASGTRAAGASPDGGTADASNVWLSQWSPAPDPNCLPRYLTVAGSARRPRYGCRFLGMIPVRIDGQLWSTTYWSLGGASVTEFSAHAEPVPGTSTPADIQAYHAAEEAGDAAAPPAMEAARSGG